MSFEKGKYKIYSLGDIADMKYGKMPKKGMAQESGKYPVFSGYRIVGYCNECNLKDQQLIVVARGVGGTGDVKLSPGACYLTNLSIAVILNEEIALKKYVFYYFQQHNLRYLDSGSAQSQITISDLKNIEIPVPPLNIQKKIVDILSSFDEKIVLNNKINENLEQQAQALFTAWFVKFLPFNGKAPDNWKNIPFSDFLVQSKEKSDDPNIPMYSVTDTGIFPRSEKFKKVLSMTRAKNKVIRQTDLVFGMSREILNWGIMRDSEGGVSSAYNVYHVDRSINSFYLESYIKSNISLFKDLIKPAAREGQGIDKAALMQKTLLLPPKEILDNYYELENVYTSIMNHIQAENKTLTEIRDELLPKLMSGEIDVEDVKI